MDAVLYGRATWRLPNESEGVLYTAIGGATPGMPPMVEGRAKLEPAKKGSCVVKGVDSP
jgi:hypothetical protein